MGQDSCSALLLCAFRRAVRLIEFIGHGGIMNPSHVNPSMIGKSMNNYLVMPGTQQGYSTFVMSVMVTESSVTKKKLIFEQPWKLLSGIPHIIEFDTMVAVINMGFGIQTADVDLCNNALTFSSRHESGSFSGGCEFSQHSMFLFLLTVIFFLAQVKNPGSMFAAGNISSFITNADSIFKKPRTMLPPSHHLWVPSFVIQACVSQWDF